MSEPGEEFLSEAQLAVLQSSLQRGSAHASRALRNWIGKHSVIEIDSLEQLPLQEATAVLSAGNDPICFCLMEITGFLTGEMIAAFDDASGWALADMLLSQAEGTTTQWTEMVTSAVLETTNILCCAYLNSLSDSLAATDESTALIPTPPTFNREFAESLMQFALMGQAIAFDTVILARTRFEIDRSAVNWTMLFVPDADSMAKLPKLLDRRDAQP